jgi:diguanylate cyclase (GGDEF)-like protein
LRVAGRNDIVLLAGLVVAIAVVFSEQLARLASTVRQLDSLRGVQFVPALAMLAAVLIVAAVWRSHENRRGGLPAKSTGRAQVSGAGLSAFAAITSALGNAQDFDAIRAVAAAHLPCLLPGRGIWIVTRGRAKRDELAQADREVRAGTSGGASTVSNQAPVPGGHPADLCFPMLVGGTAVGTLGVSSTPALTDDETRAVSAAASLLALAVRNAELRREVRENSVRDALTGCFTRAHALEVLEVELRRARRTQMPLSILRMDLDNFVSITERRGDLCGDTVLAAVGQRLKASLRGSDVKCRFGAEAFLVILPDTPINGALKVSETLAREVRRDVVSWDGSHVPVSASFGVATIRTGEVDPSAALARANEALQKAKQRLQGHDADAEYVAVPA